jgi:hypothetical protein
MSSYFSSSGGSSPIVGSGSSNATTPTLGVATIAVADTEQSYALPTGTKWFSIINQSVPVLKIAYSVGQSGILWREIPRGCSTVHSALDSTASVTIYFQAATVGGRIEFESWQ